MGYEPISSRDTLDVLFLELAKTYRRIARKYAIKLEIIVVGGASVVLNYGFRPSTYDVDVMVTEASVLKEAAKRVASKYHLEPNWLNTDFKRTSSYSDKLIEVSQFYKSYLGLIEIRTIKDEYLVAMKLMAGRDSQNDLSDIVGILVECHKAQRDLTKSSIEKAVVDLYGSLDRVSSETWNHLDLVLDNESLEFLYDAIRDMEQAYHEARLTTVKIIPSDRKDNTAMILDILKIKSGK